jgi:hypothetical protein
MTTIIVVENLDYDDLDFILFIRIKTSSNVIMDNTIVVDFTIKIISISPFPNPL